MTHPRPHHQLSVDFLDKLAQLRSQAHDSTSSSASSSCPIRDLYLKVDFCGPAGCGKSGLVSRWAESKSTPYSWKSYTPTIGVSFCAAPFTCPSYSPAKHNVVVQMYDLSGADRFKSVVRYYFRESSVIVFCYSLEDVVLKGVPLQELIQPWVHEVSTFADSGRILVPVVCGTKSDLIPINHENITSTNQTLLTLTDGFCGGGPSEAINCMEFNRRIEDIVATALADAGCRCEIPVKGFITSAKENVGIDEVMDYVVRRCVGLVQGGTSGAGSRTGAVRLPSAHVKPKDSSTTRCPN